MRIGAAQDMMVAGFDPCHHASWTLEVSQCRVAICRACGNTGTTRKALAVERQASGALVTFWEGVSSSHDCNDTRTFPGCGGIMINAEFATAR